MHDISVGQALRDISLGRASGNELVSGSGQLLRKTLSDMVLPPTREAVLKYIFLMAVSEAFSNAGGEFNLLVANQYPNIRVYEKRLFMNAAEALGCNPAEQQQLYDRAVDKISEVAFDITKVKKFRAENPPPYGIFASITLEALSEALGKYDSIQTKIQGRFFPERQSKKASGKTKSKTTASKITKVVFRIKNFTIVHSVITHTSDGAVSAPMITIFSDAIRDAKGSKIDITKIVRIGSVVSGVSDADLRLCAESSARAALLQQMRETYNRLRDEFAKETVHGRLYQRLGAKGYLAIIDSVNGIAHEINRHAAKDDRSDLVQSVMPLGRLIPVTESKVVAIPDQFKKVVYVNPYPYPPDVQGNYAPLPESVVLSLPPPKTCVKVIKQSKLNAYAKREGFPSVILQSLVGHFRTSRVIVFRRETSRQTIKRVDENKFVPVVVTDISYAISDAISDAINPRVKTFTCIDPFAPSVKRGWGGRFWNGKSFGISSTRELEFAVAEFTKSQYGTMRRTIYRAKGRKVLKISGPPGMGDH